MMPEVVPLAFAPCVNLLPQGKVVITLDGQLVAIIRVTIRRNADAPKLTLKEAHVRTSDRVVRVLGISKVGSICARNQRRLLPFKFCGSPARTKRFAAVQAAASHRPNP